MTLEQAQAVLYARMKEAQRQDFPYEYICQKCGNPSFYLTEKPEPCSLLKSGIIWHLDGSKAEWGSLPKCESCGETLSVLRTEQIQKVAS